MTERPGLAAIAAEMSRQHQDARASLAAAAPGAEAVAASIRATTRLTLLGMGGSHWVNRTAATLYRRLGLDVAPEVLSEVLITPLPPVPRTVLITSQSGASGEVVLYLDSPPGAEQRFGITLDPASPLGSRIPALVGQLGPERAFAATRSLLVTLTLHLAVLEALGAPDTAARAELERPFEADIGEAMAALGGADHFVLSGRGELQGIAEAGALCIMELARRPGLGLEGGQLRHGPMEMLSRQTGIILLRPQGPAAALAPGLVAACRAAGAPVVVFDVSGEAPADGAVTLSLPAASGMAAAFAVLPSLQRLLVALAAERVVDVGLPVRSTKVTTEI